MPTSRKKNSDRQETNRYSRILERVFLGKWKKGDTSVPFVREDLQIAAQELGIPMPKNLGDVIYANRYRATKPHRIAATQPEGKEWVIRGRSRSEYSFVLVPLNRVIPDPNFLPIKVPDATPEIIDAYALSDEQALLAKLRYNRLIDVFLGITAYSLQNHLRTTVSNIGQVEIDELYVGLDRSGAQFVVPVQAKGGSDQLSTVQTEQDVSWCRERLSALVCRPVSAQFMSDNVIALFELRLVDDEIRIVDQRHYQLVSHRDIAVDELSGYRANR